MEITGMQMLGIVIGLIGTVITIIHVFKYRFNAFRNNHLQRTTDTGTKRNGEYRCRTYPQVDVFHYSARFFQVGLLIAITLVYGLFQWTNGVHKASALEAVEEGYQLIEVEEIPLTTHKRPPLPKVPEEWREIKADPEAMIDLIEEELPHIENIVKTEPGDTEVTGREAPFTPIAPPIIPMEESPLWVVAEDMPRFPGCESGGSKKEKEACAQEKLLAFIYSHIQYPGIASKNGIEGTTVISFVIEKDGSVRLAKVVREIGGGCGQEALRVVELMNANGLKWTPGRQQGKPVRVQFNLPVKFKLK